MKPLLAVILTLIPHGCMPSPAGAAEFTVYGCHVYSMFMGEVGYARDQLRHKSQMEWLVHENMPREPTKTQLDIAAFMLRDISRVYDRPIGSEEIQSARNECLDKSGNLDKMWEAQ